MASEAVQYVNGRPVLQDGLLVYPEIPMCSECEAEYRVHYSPAEQAWLDELGLQANNKINKQHPDHQQTISLTHDGTYPSMRKSK
jgi:hypothetical protein